MTGSSCSELHWAFCDVVMSQAIWRAASDVAAQVAHWVVTGEASHADLVVARDRVRSARRGMADARRRYSAAAAASLAARKAG